MEKFAIVIPAYNEAATIKQVTTGALATGNEVIIVDDGSSDDTVAEIQGLPVTLLRHECNSGKAAAFSTGAQHAIEQGATAIITLDGDGQHKPEDIQRFIQHYIGHPGEIIVGSRLSGRAAFPPERYRAVTIADFWISWAAGQKLEDSQCGFRLYPADFLKQLRIRSDRNRSFVFESEILIEAVRNGYPVGTVRIDAIYDDDSRPSHFRPVLDIVRITRMVFWKIVSRGLFLPGLYRAHIQPVIQRARERGMAKDSLSMLVLSNVVLIASGGLFWLYYLTRITYTAIRTPADTDHKGWRLVPGKRLSYGALDEDFTVRLTRAIELWHKAPKIPILVLGGATDRDGITEAVAGKRYLLDQGVDPSSIITEDESPHTLENLRRARNLLYDNQLERPVLITNRYHLGRSYLFARSVGLDPVLCAAENGFSFTFGEVLRLLREAYYLHWYQIGVTYAKVFGDSKMLERLT